MVKSLLQEVTVRTTAQTAATATNPKVSKQLSCFTQLYQNEYVTGQPQLNQAPSIKHAHHQLHQCAAECAAEWKAAVHAVMRT